VYWELRQHEGFGDWEDARDSIESRFGRDAADAFETEIRNATDLPRGTVLNPAYAERRVAKAALVGLPAPLFLTAIELALPRLSHRGEVGDLIEGGPQEGIAHINELFRRRGINFVFTDAGVAEWHGDPQTYERTIVPARSALDDSRLSASKREFEDALHHLRLGTPRSLENAVSSAAQSVESAMKVLLDAREIPRPERETADPLWNALRRADAVPGQTKNALLAAAQLRNEFGGHGAGQTREMPPGIPDLCVSSAASALAYLAGLLP